MIFLQNYNIKNSLVSISKRNIFTSIKQIDEKEFNFIIVGAGSAGTTLALRLSESPKANVLLIEAGGETRNKLFLPGTNLDLVSCPATFAALQFRPEIDWSYKTSKQIVFQNSNNPGVVPYARGKGLGGSSAINYNMWVRGVREDFDNWENLGATGWSFQGCLPYFIKSEDVQPAIEGGHKFDSSKRGIKGFIKVSLNGPDPMLDKWAELNLAALKKKGVETSEDINSLSNPRNFAGRNQYSIVGGERCSTDIALMQSSSRQNLFILTGQQASKIVFNGKRAVGVELMDHITKEKSGIVKAKNEIVLSAGFIGSPHLLMLSGIGPKAHIESLGIHSEVNLPGVGQNLSDHLFMVAHVIGEPLRGLSFNPPEQFVNPNSIEEYITKKSGSLSKVLTDIVGFVKLTKMREDSGPDSQLFLTPMNLNSVATLFDFAKKPPFCLPEDEPSQTFMFSVAQPKSRGNIFLQSSKPTDYPIIDHHFLEHPEDQKTLLSAYRFVENLVSTDNLKGTRISTGKLYNDQDILNFIKNSSFHGWHGCGTCKMGKSSDPYSVVDPKLRVKEVDGLRVCDTSIFPVVTSGNTNAPVIMAAEKGADIIKEEYDELF